MLLEMEIENYGGRWGGDIWDCVLQLRDYSMWGTTNNEKLVFYIS